MVFWKVLMILVEIDVYCVYRWCMQIDSFLREHCMAGVASLGWHCIAAGSALCFCKMHEIGYAGDEQRRDVSWIWIACFWGMDEHAGNVLTVV